MALRERRYTVEDFEAFVDLPENRDRLFEFVAGAIVEIPPDFFSAVIAARLNFHIGNFTEENQLGHLTGVGGGYEVSGERYAADVAFLSYQRQRELPRHGYNPIAPDLAVEVVSPTDSERELMIKVTNYLLAGTLVWVVYPDNRQVVVYAPGQRLQIFGVEDTLDGGDVLPGFTLPVKDIFPPETREPSIVQTDEGNR